MSDWSNRLAEFSKLASSVSGCNFLLLSWILILSLIGFFEFGL
jgi:hypothetical protein